MGSCFPVLRPPLSEVCGTREMTKVFDHQGAGDTWGTHLEISDLADSIVSKTRIEGQYST